MKNYSPWEGPTLQKFIEDCLLGERTHAGAGEQYNRGNVMNWPQLPVPKTLHYYAEKGEKMQSEVESGKKGEAGASVLWFEFFLTVSFWFNW